MKGQLKFISAVVGGCVALLVFYSLLVGPVVSEADAEQTKLRNLSSERSGYFRASGRAISEVEAEFERTAATLEKLSESLSGAELAIPPALSPEQNRTVLDFQKRLAAHADRARAAGIEFGESASQLGFPSDISDDQLSEYLARLAVVGRFIDAAAKAGLKSVIGAEMPSREVARADDATIELEEFPYRVTLATDEKVLIRLLQELSRPGAFLAVRELVVEVRDPDSGAFEATMTVAGVRPQASSEKVETESDEPTRQPGTVVPVRRRRY